MARVMDQGFHVFALVANVTGGTDDKPNIGMNIQIYYPTEAQEVIDNV
jgi:hypothetical protein